MKKFFSWLAFLWMVLVMGFGREKSERTAFKIFYGDVCKSHKSRYLPCPKCGYNRWRTKESVRVKSMDIFLANLGACRRCGFERLAVDGLRG